MISNKGNKGQWRSSTKLIALPFRTFGSDHYCCVVLASIKLSFVEVPCVMDITYLSSILHASKTRTPWTPCIHPVMLLRQMMVQGIKCGEIKKCLTIIFVLWNWFVRYFCLCLISVGGNVFVNWQQRGRSKEEEFVKKIQQMMMEEEKQRIPIAQGLPWTTDEPEVNPQSNQTTFLSCA